MAEPASVDPPAPPDRRSPTPTPRRWDRGWRGELGRLLEIVALVGLVVTQPLLDVLGRSPDFFLFHSADPAQILLLLALVTVVPTVAVALLGALSRLAGPPAPSPTPGWSGCWSPPSPCRWADT